MGLLCEEAVEGWDRGMDGSLEEGKVGNRYSYSFIPILSPVTIPQVVVANENVFSVNLPGKITDK